MKLSYNFRRTESSVASEFDNVRAEVTTAAGEGTTGSRERKFKEKQIQTKHIQFNIGNSEIN